VRARAHTHLDWLMFAISNVDIHSLIKRMRCYRWKKNSKMIYLYVPSHFNCHVRVKGTINKHIRTQHERCGLSFTLVVISFDYLLRGNIPRNRISLKLCIIDHATKCLTQDRSDGMPLSNERIKNICSKRVIIWMN